MIKNPKHLLNPKWGRKTKQTKPQITRFPFPSHPKITTPLNGVLFLFPHHEQTNQ